MGYSRLVMSAGIAAVAAILVGAGLLEPAGAWAAPGQREPADPQPLLELVAPGGTGRLYTLNDGEARSAGDGGFQLQSVRTGYMRARAFPGSMPLYRLRLKDRPAYLATASESERADLTRPGARFVDEGVIGYVAKDPAPGTMALWRYRNAGEWRLVLERDRAEAVGQGYTPDGVVGHVYPEWFRAGAIYFGSWNADARNVIDATKRTYGRDGDWWGGVRDYSGMDPAVPQNRWLWPNDDFSALKPAIGFYDDSKTETVEKHIGQAAGAGLRYFSFYWYWNRDLGRELFPNGGLRSFLRASNRDRLDFMVSVCAHAYGTGSLTIPVAQYGTVATLLVRDFLSQPNALRANDGRPLLQLCDTRGLGSGSTADVKAFVDRVRATARGVMGEDIMVLSHRDLGLDNGAIGADGSYCGARVDAERSYPRYVDGHRAYLRSIPGALLRCVMSDFDERPGYPHMVPNANDIRVMEGQTPELFGRATAAVREDIVASTRPPLIDNMVLVYAWNEYHEGGIIEPGATTGCTYLDILRRELRLTSGDGCVTLAETAPGGGSDTTAPTLRLRLRVAKRQRALRTRRIVVRARCSESCKLRGRATARLKRLPRTREARRSARAGRTVTMKLRLAPRARKRIARALRSRRAVRTVIRVRATDAAGNVRVKRARTLIVRTRR